MEDEADPPNETTQIGVRAQRRSFSSGCRFTSLAPSVLLRFVNDNKSIAVEKRSWSTKIRSAVNVPIMALIIDERSKCLFSAS